MRLLARAKNFLKPSTFVTPSQQVLAELHQEITESVNKAYQNKRLMVMHRSTSVKHLLESAIGFYVGSTSCPRNLTIVDLLIETAKDIAKTEEEKLDIMYYEHYLEKLDAMGQGNTDKFDQAEEELLELADKGHPTAQFMVGMEMYKVAKNIQDRKKRKQQAEMLSNAINMMNISIENGSYAPFYTLGTMFEDGDIVPKIDYQSALEYYRIAASADHPLAFFKLSQYYKEGKAVDKNNQLYIHYLRKAATLGAVEAQHNLAMEYLEGKLVKKDDVKALSWLLHAGACGFPHSKYNAALLLLKGTSCGRLKPNLKAALVKFEQVQKQGDIDATDIISKIVVLLQQEDLKRQGK